MILSSFAISANVIASLFGVMVVGYLVKKALKLEKREVKRFNTLVFYTFLPVMLFQNIRTSDLRSTVNGPLIAYSVGVLLLLFILSWWFVVRVEPRQDRRGVMIQACFRANFLLLGLSMVQELCPGADLGSVALLTAVMLPCFNVLAIVTLEYFNGSHVNTREIAVGILKNPLIIASALGVVVALLQIPIPSFLDRVVSQLSTAASPVALVLLGAQFEWGSLKDQKRQLGIVTVARLIVYPAVALTGAALLGFTGVEFATLLALFSSPVAINSFNMACQLGGDADLAANAVTVTTLLSALTMFLWIFLFKMLGMF
ncbi:MAG: AEC family transporter [Oscillospiraceae bacterium]